MKVPLSVIANADERRAFLTSVLHLPLPEQAPVQSMINASDQLNRMDNLYINRSESKSLSLHADVTEALKGYTPDELRKMLAAMSAEG